MGLGLLLIPSLGATGSCGARTLPASISIDCHLLFGSALVGLGLALVGHLIALVLNEFVPQFRSFCYAYIPVEYVDTAILSILLAAAVPPVINRFHSEERAAKRTAENYGDLIELMISRAFEQSKLIELSLKNRKSYIGVVLQSNITKRGQSDVILVPLASGYRSEDTLQLHITTDYVPIIYEMIDNNPDEIPKILRDFNVVLPRSEVCSARIFDPEAYRLFQRSRR